jgi:uncharacterized protein YndB with AHSA1/START domain
MSAQRPHSRSGTRGYAHLIEVKVPVGRVWRALTEPRWVRIWQNLDAEIDARPGGIYRVGQPGAGGREAHIDIFDPNRRLRLIYLNGPDLPRSQSAIVDDFLVDSKAGKTAVRLLGSGIPGTEVWDRPYVKMRLSWERLLARLRVMLENPPRPKQPAEPPADPPLPGLDF